MHAFRKKYSNLVELVLRKIRTSTVFKKIPNDKKNRYTVQNEDKTASGCQMLVEHVHP